MTIVPHGLLIPHVCKIFEDLQVAATLYFLESTKGLTSSKLWVGDPWVQIHEISSAQDFEVEHGLISERHVYNERCIRRVQRKKETVLGHHAGFSDFFVPITSEGRMQAVLVTGPFATAPPTSTDLLERWRKVTGRQGHPDDPEFSHFVGATSSTLVLDGELIAKFRRMLGCLADLMVGRGSTETLAADVASLRVELLNARFAERVWDAARAMVDERTGRVWSDPVRGPQRRALGLTGSPEHVVVGLVTSRHQDSDPVADLLRRHAFQRACVGLGRARKTVMSGKIGDNGVTFLCVGQASVQRSRRRLVDLAEQASSMARRRFGLALHCGVSVLPLPLPAQYQAALAAAESALSRGLPIAHADASVSTAGPLGKLRHELAQLVEKDPKALPAHFDRFLEAVAVRSGYRAEPARVHVEAAFERLSEALLRSGALEPKGAVTLHASMERALAEASTISDIFAVYRRAADDMVAAVEHPAPARRERSLRRARDYLRQHYAEQVTLKQIARLAGFAPNYFSQLFHEKEGMTFAGYLTHLRIERAQELLIRTPLNLQRVAQLCGFSSADYLSRVFKRATSETPIHYRWRARHEKRPTAKRRYARYAR
jgi:AraC-like DNA-binding protein